LFLPQVPQQDVRSQLRPELHQYLLETGCYSTICAPIFIGGRSEAALLVSRDAPGRPYTNGDVDFVTGLAERVTLAHARVTAVTGACADRRRMIRTLRADAFVGIEEFSADVFPALLGAAELDDAEAAIALVDLDLHHIACTKAYAALFGREATHMAGVAVSTLARDANWLTEVLDFMAGDQLDFGTFDAEPPGMNGRVMLHAAMVRRRDATKRCVVVTAHAVPERETFAGT
jgi:PAS domain-containing protein